MRVVAAYDLVNADWFSLSDPYAKAGVSTATTMLKGKGSNWDQ